MRAPAYGPSGGVYLAPAPVVVYPAALARMSLGAQLALTRALVRNVADRLELANSRVAR